MKANLALVLAVLAGLLPATAHAQTFPKDTVPPTADELKLRITGKSFHAQLSGGGTWHVDYKPGGGFRMKTRNSLDGPEQVDEDGGWEARDGRICRIDLRGATVCNEVRVSGDHLYMLRENGEVVQIDPD
jgi:hypothetical protein